MNRTRRGAQEGNFQHDTMWRGCAKDAKWSGKKTDIRAHLRLSLCPSLQHDLALFCPAAVPCVRYGKVCCAARCDTCICLY